MTNLPKQYQWLYDIDGPLSLKQAVLLYGTIEKPGSGSNPTILTWADECGLEDAYSNDAIPWCGLFVAVCMKRAGWKPVDNPLWARNWCNYGTGQKVAMLGDILVFPRGSGGHVAFYVGEDTTHYHILGGNQSNRVSIIRKPKTPILAIRRSKWRVRQPDDVKVVKVSPSGIPIGGSEI